MQGISEAVSAGMNKLKTVSTLLSKWVKNDVI